ncbi:MAG: DUF2254 domain-containing protein [Actinomycetota bacterium]|nr:DUF2254 domain-containing protein [Actinomycetota bacterium]
MIVLVPRIGGFVVEGAPLFQVSGLSQVSGGDPDRDWLHREVVLADERTMEQDVAFGFRQLVDVAERALSPSVNDPTTACQAIDVLHDLLRRLATRRLPTGFLSDGDGRSAWWCRSTASRTTCR